jgi:hypothetical protein
VIVLVTGPPGSGKSFYAVRKIGEALDAGKPVATNVELSEDACERVARSNRVRRLRPGRVGEVRARVARGVLVAADVTELFRVRLHGRGEGRGVMVLDEAHVWLNARAWSAQDRELIVTFFTQHRKLGWDVYLIVQDAEMIDKQVRVLIEYQVQLRNLRRARLFGVLPFSPVDLFLAIWSWHGVRGKPVRRELFPLSWQKRLYRTDQLHGAVAGEDGEAVWLPRAVEVEAGPDAASAVAGAGEAVDDQAADDGRESAAAPLEPGQSDDDRAGLAAYHAAQRARRESSG